MFFNPNMWKMTLLLHKKDETTHDETLNSQVFTSFKLDSKQYAVLD